MIELRALHLVELQRKLRSEMVSSFRQDTILDISLDRRMYRRNKSSYIRDEALTETLEKAQREALVRVRVISLCSHCCVRVVLFACVCVCVCVCVLWARVRTWSSRDLLLDTHPPPKINK